MLKIIQEIEDKFTAAKNEIGAMIGLAKMKVADATILAEGDVKAAEADFFSKIEGSDVSISQAFAAGAKWSADHIAALTTAEAPAATSDQAQNVEKSPEGQKADGSASSSEPQA